MDNDVYFKKYLINLGMNPEWTELPAVMEVIKARFSKALKDKPKHFRIKETQITLGKSSEASEVTPNKITLEEFELGDEERFIYSSETGMINYIKTRGKANFEKREIDPQSGVVMHHVKRFGGNAISEKEDSYYSLIEHTRDPKKPEIEYRTVYKNISRKDSDVQEGKIIEYDYGYPVELEKNGAIHKKTPIYFIKRYPRYEEWFNKRFRSRDEYVQKVFSMQKGIMRQIWSEQRKNLEARIVLYAKTKDKLDVYYSGIQEIFNTSIIGPVFKLFITNQIENIIINNEDGMFFEVGSGERMIAEIKSKLEQEVEQTPLEETVKEEGEKVVARIGANPDYQTAKETFSGEIKSVEDEEYSIEEALVDIHEQSNLVEEFYQSDNPFQQEKDRLDEKIDFMEAQIKVLKKAYKAFPRRKKNLREAVKDIENKELKKKILPTTPPPPNDDGR